MISPPIKNKIEDIVNVFESGSINGNYGTLVKFKDYTDPLTHTNLVQITFGRSQTTEFGNLKGLLKMYVESNGQYAHELENYINRVGKKPSLSTDKVFCDTLIKAGKNDPVMKTCQDDFFDSYYFLPAYSWFHQMGFTLPLSMLVIYDSEIHSGGVPDFLRKRFPEKPPVKGGDEKTWIKQYVDVRHQWLKTHSKKILQGTVYRTQCFKTQIQNDNWYLTGVVRANGINIM
jgi:chitosanase